MYDNRFICLSTCMSKRKRHTHGQWNWIPVVFAAVIQELHWRDSIFLSQLQSSPYYTIFCFWSHPVSFRKIIHHVNFYTALPSRQWEVPNGNEEKCTVHSIIVSIYSISVAQECIQLYHKALCKDAKPNKAVWDCSLNTFMDKSLTSLWHIKLTYIACVQSCSVGLSTVCSI